MVTRVGIAGGFGSGKKETVFLFKQLRIPIYDSNEALKRIILKDKEMKNVFYQTFLPSVPIEQKNKKKYLNQFLLPYSPINLEKILKFNDDVYLKLLMDFNKWAKRFEKEKYVLFMFSSIFDAQIHKNFDKTIHVSCPIPIRLDRLSKKMFQERGDINHHILKQEEMVMKSQFEDKIKDQLADYVVENSGVTPLWPQVLKIDKELCNLNARV